MKCSWSFTGLDQLLDIVLYVVNQTLFLGYSKTWTPSAEKTTKTRFAIWHNINFYSDTIFVPKTPFSSKFLHCIVVLPKPCRWNAERWLRGWELRSTVLFCYDIRFARLYGTPEIFRRDACRRTKRYCPTSWNVIYSSRIFILYSCIIV